MQSVSLNVYYDLVGFPDNWTRPATDPCFLCGRSEEIVRYAPSTEVRETMCVQCKEESFSDFFDEWWLRVGEPELIAANRERLKYINVAELCQEAVNTFAHEQGKHN